MLDTRLNCLPTMIGSMPYKDAETAWQVTGRFLKDLPAWPQLPERTFLEDMNVQYSEGFPGLVLNNKRVYVDRTRKDIHTALESLYTAYLENDSDKYPVGKDYAAGLYAMLSSGIKSPAVKGQVTGPVTWGLSITDETKKSIIYDDDLGDAVPKFIRFKASWQEKILKQISKNTIIFFDEPYMTAFGSATLTLSKEKAISLLNEALQGVTGLKGVHCCGNTDWSVLTATNTDIISFDTYNFGGALSLYPDEIKRFLDRKGAIAWGIVPNTEDALQKETVASLSDRLQEAMAPFSRNGIPFPQLIEQGLLTPSCGLEGLSEEMAGYALQVLVELSEHIRIKYVK